MEDAPTATGDSGRVYLLQGEEELGKSEAADRIVAKHLDPSTRDFNLDVVRGSNFDQEQFASILATPPMMAECRVVVLKETEALSGSSTARELLLGVARKPPAGLVLLLLATPPARTKAKFWSDLQRLAETKTFREVSLDDAPGWLIERARVLHERELEPEAAQALAQAIGPQLGILAAELEKLIAVAGDGPVTVDVVREAGTVLPRQDRWAWFDLVGSRKFSRALDALPVLLDQGETGIGLASGMATHLLRVGLAVEEGPDGLRSALPPNQAWLASRLAQQAAGWTAGSIRDAIVELSRVDRRLKRGGAGRALLEEWFLVRLATV